MRRKPWYAAMAIAWDARKRCENTAGSEWRERWGVYIDELCEMLPSGSGFDRDITIESVSDGSIELAGSYHVMSEHGFYAGWAEFTVTIRSTLTGVVLDVWIDTDDLDDLDVEHLKEYIGDVIYEVISADVDPIGTK